MMVALAQQTDPETRRIMARLGSLRGREEIAVGVDPDAALDLLDALLPEDTRARDLAPRTRDLLLASVFVALYGDAVRSSTTCRACAASIGITFSLGALLEHRPDDEDDKPGATTLDHTLSGVCPVCGERSPVRFEIGAFLVAALAREKGYLHREVHTIARGYGWSRDDILDLDREERRAYARLILGAASRRRAR